MIVANTCIAEIDDWFNENNCNPMVLNHEDGLRTSVSLHYPAVIVYLLIILYVFFKPHNSIPSCRTSLSGILENFVSSSENK